MPQSNIMQAGKRILKILDEKPILATGELTEVVSGIRARSKLFEALVEKFGTPFYAFDEETLKLNIRNFKQVFSAHLPSLKAFYAMKANHHPLVIRTVLEQGLGIDVSSGRELKIARAAGAKKILFSGPGKTALEHELALKNSRLVTVNLDSFGELERLGRMAARKKQRIRAGVRIHVKTLGGWDKFGIPLSRLKEFWKAAGGYAYLSLQGIQFHISWNRQPSAYAKMIREIGVYLKKNFSKENLRRIKFIDFGGGYYPDRAEGHYPWTAHYPGAWPGNKIISLASDYLGKSAGFRDKYYITESAPLSRFACGISKAIGQYLGPLLDCEYYSEPGRILVNDAMHVVTRIIDCKRKDFVIADGGVNIVGWEYGEYFYFPLVNLTHPSKTELKCTVTGPLCTPHDTWGYYCYASKMREGDLVVVPNQGAYKYALAQNFIKPVPGVHRLDSYQKKS